MLGKRVNSTGKPVVSGHQVKVFRKHRMQVVKLSKSMGPMADPTDLALKKKIDDMVKQIRGLATSKSRWYANHAAELYETAKWRRGGIDDAAARMNADLRSDTDYAAKVATEVLMHPHDIEAAEIRGMDAEPDAKVRIG